MQYPHASRNDVRCFFPAKFTSKYRRKIVSANVRVGHRFFLHTVPFDTGVCFLPYFLHTLPTLLPLSIVLCSLAWRVRCPTRYRPPPPPAAHNRVTPSTKARRPSGTRAPTTWSGTTSSRTATSSSTCPATRASLPAPTLPECPCVTSKKVSRGDTSHLYRSHSPIADCSFGVFGSRNDDLFLKYYLVETQPLSVHVDKRIAFLCLGAREC